MTDFYISEYNQIGQGADQNAQLPKEPSLATQTNSFTTTSVPSNAFDDDTTFVCISASGDCHVDFGTTPTATTSKKKLTAGVDYYFGVSAGHKVAFIDAA